MVYVWCVVCMECVHVRVRCCVVWHGGGGWRENATQERVRYYSAQSKIPH